MVPPGNNGSLIAAASRFAMPSNMAFTGARTACSSGVAARAAMVGMLKAIVPITNEAYDRWGKSFMGSDCKPSDCKHSTRCAESNHFLHSVGIQREHEYPFTPS